MAGTAVVIHLRLFPAGDSLAGSAHDGHGTACHFDGRLGLLAAIDALMARAADEGAPRPGDRDGPPTGA